MAYVLPTLEETHAFLIALFKVLLPDRTVARLSFNWKLLRVLAGGVTDNHHHIHASVLDLMPDTAEKDALIRWGNLLGVTKKSATPSRKDNALRVVGVPGSAVPLGAPLTHTNTGLRFQVNGAAVVPAGGSVDVDVLAISTGAATRLNADEELTFDAAPVGLEETARLVLDLDQDGEDVESDGAYRRRVLSRFSNPPLGGAQEDFAQWALRQTGIAYAYVYPNRRGLGSVDVAALHLGSGDARVLSEPERLALETALHDLRPVATAGLIVLRVVPETVDVEVEIITTGESQYTFDWDDSAPPEVAVWNSGTRLLTFFDSRPETMAAGHRLTFGDGTGAQYVIESLSDTDSVVLEDVPEPVPEVGGLVYSGGPIVESVRDALLSHIDNLGTANPDEIRYGSWEGNLRPAAIIRVASNVPGVLDVDSVIPASTVEADDPRFPDDETTIGLIVPGRVLVRRAHP
jgi:uncharacterized phage protein gp47/JayE